MSVRYDIAIERGETFSRSFSYKDPFFNNIFATAISAHAQIRVMPTSNAVVSSFSCSFNSDKSLLTIVLNANDSRAIVGGNYFYDVRVTFPGDVIQYIIYGKIKIKETVTRNV